MRPTIFRNFLMATTAGALLATSGVMALAADDDLVLDEIVVTSQRRAEKLQDVPISVTAFSATQIEAAGITNTQDFINLTPNVSLDDSFTYANTFIVVRGVTQINNADSPVAVIVDGVAQNNQKQLKMNLFDVERIEVLKGPQGALYGRNAIGGAINIVTKQPSNDMEGFARADYGRGDTVELTGGVSGPIVKDKLLFRLAGFYKQSDGNIKNSFTGKNVDFIDHDYTLRGKMLFMVSENVTIDVRASYTNFQAGSIYDSLVDSGNANDIQLPREDFEGVTNGKNTELTLKLDAELGFATLTAISGYTDLKESYRGDLDFGNPVDDPGGFLGFLGPVGQGQNLDVQLLSQEVRLTSPDDQALRWIVGGYFLSTDRSLLTRAFFDVDHTGGQFETGVRLVELNEDNNNTAWALFGQFDFDVTSQLTLSGALRYDEDQRDQDDLVGGGNRKKTFNSLQPKVTLTYKATQDALIYTTYSTGFRSGGFNAPGLGTFNDETIDNYEAGFKSSWFDKRLVLNGAAFFSQSHDFQFFFVDAARAAQVISNIDKVNIKGVDFDFRALAAPGLQFYGGLGVTDTNIKKDTARPQDIGNKTPKNTSWNLNLGTQYDFPIVNAIGGFVRVDYEHRGKKYWQTDNLAVQKPVDLLDARVGIQTDRWSLTLWGRNLTNERYYADLNAPAFSGLPTTIAFLAPPRTYGVEGRIRF